jgi:hypothetical protein
VVLDIKVVSKLGTGLSTVRDTKLGTVKVDIKLGTRIGTLFEVDIILGTRTGTLLEVDIKLEFKVGTGLGIKLGT